MQLQIDYGRCTMCGTCIEVCPFGAIQKQGERLEISSACRLCRLCIRKCPEQAIRLEEKAESGVDKSLYRGVLVVAEHHNGEIHPVTYELLGKGRELADKVRHPLYAVLIGSGLSDATSHLLDRNVDTVFVYDQSELSQFSIESYTNAVADVVETVKPSVILVGATPFGRSLAPRVAVRFRTGLTADCTVLDMKDNTDLVQIRPAFGGNIMAQIVTPKGRPQLATVRYKVMDPAPVKRRPNAKVVQRRLDEERLRTRTRVIKTQLKAQEENIADAEVVIAAGRGFKSQKDLAMAFKLAELLNGQVGVTRPLVEAGWADHSRQIGLSGRTIRPKLLITCGVSGAIQFAASISGAEYIFAVNKDPDAPIFEVAHYGLVGDIYEILPDVISRLEGGQPLRAVL